MKKSLKVTLIVLGIFIGIIAFDTLQAKILNNRPFIKITENYKTGNVAKKDKGILVNTYIFTNGKKVTVYRWTKYAPPENSQNNYEEENKDTDEMKNVNVVINNQKYSATMEDNNTAEAFIKHLPQKFDMEELNGNEKYIYMNCTLPTNSQIPKHIYAGDIMLYGNDCLVIFYKSFDTSFSYTKIGHIDNLPDLGSDKVTVKFEQ